MNEEKLQEVIEVYWKEDMTEREFRLALMDVERQTRHECVSCAYDLANKLANLNKFG